MSRRIPAALCLLLALLQVDAGARDAGWSVPPGLVTAAVVQAKIEEAESDPGLDGEEKTKLVALFRKALTNLEQVERNRARANGFEEAARSAPEQTRQIRERIAEAKAAAQTGAPPDLGIALDAPLEEIARRLKLAQAERDAAVARRDALERRLAYQENLPALIRQRHAAADEEQRVIAAALQAELAGDAGAGLAQARRWSLETRYIALSAEIMALDQELASLPMHLGLLSAQRDQDSADTSQIERRIKALQVLLNDRRKDEARQSQADTERLLRASAGQDPALVRLAAQNAALAAGLAGIAVEGDRLDAEQHRAGRLAARTQASFERVKTAKAVGASIEGAGQLLLEHRAALPDFDAYDRRAETLARQIATLNLSRLRHLEEAERLDAEMATGAGTAGAASPPGLLRDLIEQRRSLLDKLIEAEGGVLERLRKLQTTEARMLEAAHAYDDFLTERLFWLPTGAKTGLAHLARLPEEARRLFSADRRAELAQLFAREVAASPAFWLTLLLSAALLWKRRALIAALQDTAAPLKHASTDRFGHTLRALLLTLALAAPGPLVLGVAGWSLTSAMPGTELSLLLGNYLIRVALALYVLLALRALCLPGGLAIEHFRWAEPDVRRLGTELRWLTWVLVPAIFLLRLSMSLNPASAGGLMTGLGLLVALVALGLFFYRVLHPRHGVLRQQRLSAHAGLLYRAYPVWFPLLVVFPLVLLVLAWKGYIYSVVTLSNAFSVTVATIIALILLHGLAVRWLRLARRRLALLAARERRRSALAARAQGLSPAAEAAESVPAEEAALDFDAASEESLQLLHSAVALVAVLGLYLIWSAVFPALGILDELTLWHTTTTIDGEDRPLPITLADLGLALIYLGVALMLAKRLPALLDMILAQRLEVASGSRYTVTALTAYAILATGILLALNTIGAQWSQLQWLVAALGVGIGFGLQEIVANFISGLIILFERPIRIGDIVTVGDTDGMVTKIRMRATTIRNWDRKELLVPNKEFITGRLLNWSLSDRVTRVMVTVGVAYGTDVEKAHALMREAAQEHARILEDPKPNLTFEGFGDNSLTLILRAFIDDLDFRLATITDLHKAINRKFQQAGISIAFPQRDLHLDTREPLRVSIESQHPDSPPGVASGAISEPPHSRLGSST